MHFIHRRIGDTGESVEETRGCIMRVLAIAMVIGFMLAICAICFTGAWVIGGGM